MDGNEKSCDDLESKNFYFNIMESLDLTPSVMSNQRGESVSYFTSTREITAKPVNQFVIIFSSLDRQCCCCVWLHEII